MKNDGYTGRNFNRPGFQAMLAEAEAWKIGTIIVKDMSRFCRNYLEVGFYTEILFPKKQIRFIAINNSVGSDKPQDNDFTPFLNIMNEWYAKDTSNKISRARQKRRSNTALFCYPEVTNSGFVLTAVKDTAVKTKPLISKENAQNRPETIQRETVLGVSAFREQIGNSAVKRRCPLCPVCRNTSRKNGRSFLMSVAGRNIVSEF